MDEKSELINKFIKYCCDELKITAPFRINFTKKTPEQPTAGFFDLTNKEITVVIKNRVMADYLRTLAHEMTHLKQLINDKIEFPNDDEGLQPYEDEANIFSGRLVRFFGRKHPQIYSL